MELKKVKLRTSRAGNNLVQNTGDVIEVEAQEAARMVQKGQAEWVREPEKASRKGD